MKIPALTLIALLGVHAIGYSGPSNGISTLNSGLSRQENAAAKPGSSRIIAFEDMEEDDLDYPVGAKSANVSSTEMCSDRIRINGLYITYYYPCPETRKRKR